MSMINRVASRWLNRLLSGVLAVGLVACGGGGGSPGSEPFPPGGGNGGGGGGTTPPPTMTVALSSNTVTVAEPATVTVTLKNSSGAAIPGVVVTFSTTLELGAFSAPSALTNADGVASVQVQPRSAASTGADTVVALATVGTTEVRATIGFQLTATNVTLTSFTSDVTTLAPYGQTSLTVLLAGTSAGAPVNVVASSTCVANGRATLTPTSVSTTTGRAVFTYRDDGCGAVAASDTVQISVTGTTITGSLTLALTPPQVSSIAFVSSTPETIFLKGSGYVENSNVKFRVNDANGNGVPEQLVEFDLTTFTGGLLLDGGQTKVSKRTDSNGEVIVRVNSGTVPTPVRVKATLNGSSISTVSSSLSVAVGLPSQLNFSLSAATLNMEGYDIDGITNSFSIIASDRLGNPVPNGTAINFVSESGQVQASRQTELLNGLARATANYVSASPRPVDGRFTVVAYALGEESFLDVNGNNVYDLGEPFQDLGDIFIDRLYNFAPNFSPARGYNNVEDQFISLGLTGNQVCLAPGSALLNLNTSMPSKPGSCNGAWGSAYVRKAIQVVLSTSAARPSWFPGLLNSDTLKVTSCPASAVLIDSYDPDDNPLTTRRYFVHGTSFLLRGGAGSGGAINFASSDANPIAYNPAAAGSVISVSATAGLAATVVGGTPVANGSSVNGASITFKFDDQTNSGQLFISYRSPAGLVSTATVGVSAVGVTAFDAAPVYNCQ
ncbi:MAG: Ig-like domain-containing protein [Inhella sp.]